MNFSYCTARDKAGVTKRGSFTRTASWNAVAARGFQAGLVFLLLMGCGRSAPEESEETGTKPLSVAPLANYYGKIVVNGEIVGSGVFIQHIGSDGRRYPYFATMRHILDEHTNFFQTNAVFTLVAPKHGGGHTLVSFPKKAATPFIDAQNNADLALIALPTEEELKEQHAAIQWVVYDGRVGFFSVYDVVLLDSKKTRTLGVEIGMETWTFGALNRLTGVMADCDKETPVSVRRGAVAMISKGDMKLIYGATPMMVIDSMVWGGDSGGPVFVRAGKCVKGNWGLLGIVVGRVNGRQFNNGVIRNEKNQMSSQPEFENSGYAYVTPGPVVAKMLEQLEIDLRLGRTSHGGVW